MFSSTLRDPGMVCVAAGAQPGGCSRVISYITVVNYPVLQLLQPGGCSRVTSYITVVNYPVLQLLQPGGCSRVKSYITVVNYPVQPHPFFR